MRYIPLFVAVLACSEVSDPASLPDAELPPPMFVVSSTTPVPGQPVTFSVASTLGEDEEVEMWVGRTGVGAGPCLAQYGGDCLGVRSPVLVGRGLVDANGEATVTVVVPATASIGAMIGLQGAVIRGQGGSRSVLSNAILLTVSATSSGTASFGYTGSAESFTVPAGVTSIDVEACGAEAGDGWNVDIDVPTGLPGGGGFVSATLPVTPGQVLSIRVGGEGEDAADSVAGLGGFNGGGNGATRLGYSGGGGGGATDIRSGGTSLSNRVLVAAGGGAGSGWCTAGTGNGGDGGGLLGANGSQCSSIAVGTGGTQFAGGTFGSALGVGGSATTNGGAGGGGGYWGGGASDGSGGGGGSSFTTVGASGVVHTQGACTGDGWLTLTW